MLSFASLLGTMLGLGMLNLSLLLGLVLAFAQEDLPPSTAEFDTSILPTEEILLKIFDVTSGLRWENRTGWLQTNSICDYYGVECYTASSTTDQRRIGHVQALSLAENRLVGTLPSEVYSLPYLETLDVRSNDDLHIEFAGIEEAQFLKKLEISETTVTSLSGLEKALGLEYLHLTNLGLDMPFPTQILSLTNLKGLLANFNKFSGTLPSEVGSLVRLEELLVFENNLDGRIPTTLGNLQQLRILGLSENSFTGTIPTELNNCLHLETLALQRSIGAKGQGLRGSLLSLDGMENLREVYIQNQELGGNIPENFLAGASETGIIRVDMSNNQLTGGIPQKLLEKQRLQVFLTGNRISLAAGTCSSLPVTWMGGDVGTLGCDAFLCRPGFSAPAGRATSTDSCQACSGATYWGTPNCNAAPGDPVSLTEERSILVSFFDQTGGPYWKNGNNWLEPGSSQCNWFGVECENGSVTAIRLRNNDLTDSSVFPGRLFLLPNLMVLDLSSNSLEFSFSGIESATNLAELDVSHTDLTSLDGIIGLRSTKIRRLSLASNRLTGAIPAGIFQLSTLEELDLSHNRFSGLFSAAISQLTNLRRLRIFGNRLNGSLPNQVGFLSQLVELNAAENLFSGALPGTLNSLTMLESLILHQTTSQSAFTGALPSLDRLSRLTSLHLDGNSLTGNLPDGFLRETNRGNDLIQVHLSKNQFSGTIPSSWASRFVNLQLDLTDNQITGFGPGVCDQLDWMDGTVGLFGCSAILCPAGTFNDLGRRTTSASQCEPCGNAQYMGSTTCGTEDDVGGSDESELDILREFFDTTHGTTWSVSSGWTVSADYCSWHGVTCNGAEVIEIDLGNNNLTGTPASSIFRLPRLRVLSLPSNRLTFSFRGISAATSLTTLDLSSTGLNSVAGIQQVPSLQELHLTDNDLSGVFPAEILELQDLRRLYLNSNTISGRLPSSVRSLNNLEELYLFGNRLSGQIPVTLGSLTRLKELVLSENNFDGKKSELCSLSACLIISVPGTLPLELNDLTNLELLALQREGGTGVSDAGVGDGSTRSSGQGITGSLIALDRLEKLKSLFLGSNSLSGMIPNNFLDGVKDKTAEILVDLFHNELTGTIPASLARFDRMTLFLSDNKISGIPDGICRKTGWMGGFVGTFTCDAILCPPGTFSKFGRHSDQTSPCQNCATGEAAEFYGSLACATEGETTLANERIMLEEVYRTCGGDSWLNQENWMDDDIPVCQWHGIGCDPDGRVESVILSRNGLSGTVPTGLLSLPNLAELSLASNSVQIPLTGIPTGSQLWYLDLRDTGLVSLSGIEKAISLRSLNVEKNNIEGWPAELFQVGNLEELRMSRNKLSIDLPANIGDLDQLAAFSCDDCELMGNLPPSIGSLTKLSHLSLKHNSLVGSLPTELESLGLLEILDLSRQVSTSTFGLTGPLLAFQNSSFLTEINFEENALSGTIPESFLESVGSASSVSINLGENLLNGTLPVALSRFDDFSLDIRDNQMQTLSTVFCTAGWNSAPATGCQYVACPVGTFNGFGRATESLPCESCPSTTDATYVGSTYCGEDLEREILEDMFASLSGQRWTRAGGWGTQDPICSWEGVSCYEGGIRDGSVRVINLPDNNMAGTVSERIWRLTHMERLDLSKNDIDVSLQSIGSAHALKHLMLSETRVNSLLGFSEANSLITLELASLGLQGSFPDEILALTNLERVALNHNQLTGNLPSNFLWLFNMKELYLENNQLNGTLPSSIVLMRDIRVLSLGKNKWTGTVSAIPASSLSIP